MKPLTRKEFFMAKAAGQTVPDLEPITREEYFLNQIAENGGGGGLPPIEEGDDGKVLTVSSGEPVWASGGGGVSITQVEQTNEGEYLELHMNSKDLFEAYVNGIVKVVFIDDESITSAFTILAAWFDTGNDEYHFYEESEGVIDFIGTENEHPKVYF